MQRSDARRRFLELFAVSALVFARPIYDGFAASPGQFVLRGAGRWTVIAFGIAVLLIPPAAIQALGFGAGFGSPRRRRVAHDMSVGAVLVIGLVEMTGLGSTLAGPMTAALVVAGGAAFVVVLAGREGTRMWLRYLALAGPLFCLQFLVLSPVSSMVLPATASAGAASGQVAVDDPHLVMIVLDELPTASLLGDDDEIDAVAYPNFARLAEESTFYRNHASVASTTASAVPALLTGRFPPSSNATPSYLDYPDNLFSLLESSYRMEIVEPYTGLCPPPTCPDPSLQEQYEAVRSLLDDAGGFWLDHLRRLPVKYEVPWVETDPAGMIDGFVDRLPSADDPPTLSFLHLLSPHQPWNRLSDGRNYGAPDRVWDPTGWVFGDLTSEGVWHDPFASGQSRVRHLQKLQFTDALLGRLLDGIEASGAGDRTMVVVVADHGVSFSAGEAPRYVSEENEPETLWSPLFVKTPGQLSGGSTDQPVQSIDVLPIIADGLGVEVPFGVDGSGLEPSGSPRSYITLGGERVELDESGFREMLDLGPGRVGDTALGMWKSGPLGELVGEPIDGFATRRAGSSSGSARLNRPGSFDAVDPAGPLVPVYLAGRLSVGDGSSADEGDVAVIALNDRVAGFSQLRRSDGGSLGFAIASPPDLLVVGDNELRLGVVPAGTTVADLRGRTVEIPMMPLG